MPEPAEETPFIPASPLISVCIANHNYGRFLPAAIGSVLGQTYSKVELIVVDDGSTDDSREVIRRYGGRLRSVFQERGGQAAAGWAGIQAARGEVIVFLDADDTLDPQILARVASAFHEDPSLVIVQWRLGTIGVDGGTLPKVLPPRPGMLPSGDLSHHMLRVRDWHYQLTTGVAYAVWAVRRIMPPQLPEGEHHALDHWLNELVPLFGPVQSLADVGGARRVHDQNFSSSLGRSAEWPQRMIRLTLNSHEHVRRFATELGRTCPADARALRDPAFLGWRLWSRTVDPEHHPLADDRRLSLGGRGMIAALTHPHFPWRYRVKLAAWFGVVAVLPRAAARRVIDVYTPNRPEVPTAGRRVWSSLPLRQVGRTG
jgi:glycosyltransferase involved in cell wall biosynthesis